MNAGSLSVYASLFFLNWLICKCAMCLILLHFCFSLIFKSFLSIFNCTKQTWKSLSTNSGEKPRKTNDQLRFVYKMQNDKTCFWAYVCFACYSVSIWYRCKRFKRTNRRSKIVKCKLQLKNPDGKKQTKYMTIITTIILML